jgi:hypothetical protein
MAKQPKTYVAPHPVYVDRQYHKANRPFTTAAKKGDDWEEVGAVERAVSIAQDPIPPDQSVDDLSPAALEAVASEKRVPTKGLKGRKQVIAAVKAANEPAL